MLNLHNRRVKRKLVLIFLLICLKNKIIQFFSTNILDYWPTFKLFHFIKLKKETVLGLPTYFL